MFIKGQKDDFSIDNSIAQFYIYLTLGRNFKDRLQIV